MNWPAEARRKHILTNALTARTQEQLNRATRELDAWVDAHPDDEGIQWAYEQMALVEIALQEVAHAPLMVMAKAS